MRLEEEKQTFAQKLATLNKLVTDKSIEIGQANQKCARLEHEKLLMKLDWSKTEWNLKESIKDLEKEIDERETKSIKLIKDLEKVVDDQLVQITVFLTSMIVYLF